MEGKHVEYEEVKFETPETVTQQSLAKPITTGGQTQAHDRPITGTSQGSLSSLTKSIDTLQLNSYDQPLPPFEFILPATKKEMFIEDPVIEILQFTAELSKHKHKDDRHVLTLRMTAEKPYDHLAKGRTRILLMGVGGRPFAKPVDLTNNIYDWEIRDGGHCSWIIGDLGDATPRFGDESLLIRIQHLQHPIIRGLMERKTKKMLHKILP